MLLLRTPIAIQVCLQTKHIWLVSRFIHRQFSPSRHSGSFIRSRLISTSPNQSSMISLRSPIPLNIRIRHRIRQNRWNFQPFPRLHIQICPESNRRTLLPLTTILQLVQNIVVIVRETTWNQVKTILSLFCVSRNRPTRIISIINRGNLLLIILSFWRVRIHVKRSCQPRREIHIQIQRPRVTPVKIRLHHILLDIHSHGRIITDFFRSSRHAHRVRRRKRIPRQQLKPIRVLLS